MKSGLLWGSLLILIVILGYFYMPFLSVNGYFVSRNTILKRFAAAERANAKFKATYGNSSPDAEADVLNSVLEAQLIETELRREVPSVTLAPLLSSKIEAAQSGNFEKAAEDIYGLNAGDVKSFIILPQAEADILRGQFILKNKDFSVWIGDAKQKASVHLFSRGFVWTGTEFSKKS